MDLLVDLTEYEKRKYIIPIKFKGKRPSINVKISVEENKEGFEEKKNNIKEKIEELKEKISNKDDLEFYYGLVETVKGTKNPLLSEYPQHESFKKLLEEIFN
ncbi:hypothetical protein SAMN04488598_13825 [Halanaerobium congolense]|uniref:Uncharacterized protein n=1 Tax=Halanaerobium congolense TaxID=54121 RepID=A0A1I0CLD6_9FIRM|nr:hypothetical protein [Halanaerobium congolense]PTX14854.1 hypothetical protein C7953_2920 [Halanaerobium congolense]SDG02221.1 hypothetical protein SAMN04488598_13825 [Halanaerobium congolense]SET20011.1 hypothetical protein SAMN04515652_13825 [Halanaerobium congolense]SFP66727.1 hypothetical protein SAMN04488596_1381 [Halanaerobium congolense]